MSTLADKTLRGVHWAGVIKIFQQAMSWIVTIWVTRLLSPSDYGLMGIAVIVIGFSRILSEFGMGTAIIQKKGLQQIEIDTIFWIALCNGIIFSVIIILLAPVIASFFNSGEVISVLRVLSINFFLGGIAAIPLAMLTKELKFKEKSISELVAVITSNILILLFAFNGFGVWSLVIGSICNNFILLLLICYHQKFIPHFQFSLKRTVDILKFGAHIVGSRILWYFYSKSDFIIIGKFVNKENLGVYSIAFQLASMPIDKVAEIINPVAYATFSKVQDDLLELKKYFLLFIRGLSIILFPALGGLAMIANEFVTCILTIKWSGIVMPLQCLCVVGFVRVAVQPIASLLNALGKAHLNFRYNLLNVLVMPIAFFIGVKINGITGVVMAWILIYPILAGYILCIGLKELEMTFVEYARSLYPIVGSTIMMGIAIFFIKWQLSILHSDWLRLFLLVLTGVVSYSVSLFIFSPRIKEELFSFFLLREKS